ncbi:MAG TPA: efflux RND transporter periplasmic adaptor subunit [Bryobacteraceae bacterium]|jgi:RND family efflux transporter MFP subunit|nr:efflux RND transporter periplasmic adaptor subunit [Bryobacteraceae bacterium]
MSSHVDAPIGTPKLPRWAWLLIAILVCLVAGLIGFAIMTGIATRVHAADSLKQRTLDMSVSTVSVVHPKRGAPVDEVVLPGNAQAYVATPVWARTNGYLKAWYFDIGAHVKAGQLLAEIETPEVDKQLDQAQADLATAQANYDLSQTTATRYQALFKSDSVAKQDVEDRVGDLNAKKAMVDSAKYNLERLKETQRFEKVYAPFDGVITARNTDIGALINAGSNAPAKELFDIAATNRLRVYVNVPQQYSRNVSPGGATDITQAEYPGRRFTGKIVRNAEAIDPTSRTLLTEVDVDNPRGELLPGAFLSVHLKLHSKSTSVMIPVNALIFRSEGMQAAVVRDNKTELRPIAIGKDYGTEVEVVSGLSPNDEVIENPSDSLVSGAEVRIASKAARSGGSQ